MENSIHQLFTIAGMLSLLVAILTYRKQWTFFEMVNNVDEVLIKDFAVITPKKVYRKIIFIFIMLLNMMLALLVVLTYYVYHVVLEIPSLLICVSYYLANLPYFSIIVIFYTSTNTLHRRFFYVNNILRQLAPHDVPKNVFELCSRSSKNDRHQPTIVLNEIYSIYGGHLRKVTPMSPPSKSFKSKDGMEREIKKLTSKLESREENFFSQMKARNLIDVEEFKLSKMEDVDQIIEHLTKLLDVHDILLDCISLQNEILSFQILAIVAQIFVFVVFALFSLYRTIYNTEGNSNILAFANIFWLVVYNSALYTIMSISSKCMHEGKLTGTCVHKVINKIALYADPRIVEKVKVLIAVGD